MTLKEIILDLVELFHFRDYQELFEFMSENLLSEETMLKIHKRLTIEGNLIPLDELFEKTTYFMNEIDFDDEEEF